MYFIKKYRVESLLDIGAGNATLANEISKRVKSYTAIEKRYDWAKHLKDSGLKTIQGTFPFIRIPGKYDMVLSSHSIPERADLIPPFIKRASTLVKPGGILLIVTFKGGKGDIFKMTKKLEGKGIIHDELLFKKILSTLEKVGEVQIKKRNSAIQSDDAVEILNSVAISLGSNRSKKYKKQIQAMLETDFKRGSKYIFHFEHLFMAVRC